MHQFSLSRFALLVVALALMGGSPTVAAGTGFFQPLNSPATLERHPGKFVWADLFTTDPEAATKFYSGLFGWTANTLVQHGRAYTVFSNGSRPVAGLAVRPRSRSHRPSRWISYIAVTDIAATLKHVVEAGGQVRADARDFPERGWQAIVADHEGGIVGLLQSASGDSADAEPLPGDWNWFELFVKQPEAAATFYHRVIGYTTAPDRRSERVNDFLLSSDGLARAGVAPLPARENAQAGWLGVVRVEQLDEAIARTIKLGGKVLVAPREAALGSRFAIIADSTGGTLGLVEYLDHANPAQRP